MEFAFHHTIPEPDKNGLIALYEECQANAIEQHPSWPAAIDPNRRVTYFSMKRDGKFTCMAVIEENYKLGVRSASIQFGPLFADTNALIESIDHIYSHYRKLRYGFLTVQLGMETGADADYIEYQVSKRLHPRYFFDRENWSSLIIDLTAEQDQINKSFSKGHKSDIKKASKLGLRVLENFSEEKFDAFIGIYSKMHTSRGLKEPLGNSSLYLSRIKQFFEEERAGKFLLVETAEGEILGGIALVYQKGTMRYFKGAADPEKRNYPVLHAAIAYAIADAKANGFTYFDLWGYNHFVTAGDQVFHINKFKKGFGGRYIFYPKKMYFVFNNLKFNMLNIAQRLHRRYLQKK